MEPAAPETDALDALAALAHGSPEIELLAVTTVAGNQTLPKVTRNALAVARFLEGHEKISWVNYAGLESSPYHKLAAKYNNRIITLANGHVASDTAHPEVAQEYEEWLAARQNDDEYEYED